MRKRLTVASVLTVIVAILDLLTKHQAHSAIEPGTPVRVLPFFQLVNVRNRGAAFGMFDTLGNTFFITVSVLAVIMVIYLIIRNEINFIGLSLVLGGAIGNLYDRLALGYVRDFLDVHAGNYHWPAFNIADSALTVGIAIVLLAPLFEKKPSPKD
jgi:signal peptidase II